MEQNVLNRQLDGSILLKFVRMAFFLVLLTATMYYVFRGPVTTALKNETIFRSTQKKIGDLPRHAPPHLAICRETFYKNISQYKDFTQSVYNGSLTLENFTELDKTLDILFYTKPKDWLMYISFGTDYPTALARMTEVNVDDFVTTELVDFTFGFCADIDLHKVKGYLVSKGDLEPNVIHFDFMALLWLRGSNDSSERYQISLYPQGETLLMGGSSILPMNTLSLIHGEFLVSVMNYKVNQKIRDCDPFNTLISDCVEAYYTPNISDNVKGYFDRVAFNSEMKMTSLSKIANLTGCKEPCTRIDYSLKMIMTGRTERIADKSINGFENSSEKYTSFFVMRHTNADTVSVDEEVLQFTAESLISDIGGLTGIFLGISFWSLFNDLFDVLLSKIFPSKK